MMSRKRRTTTVKVEEVIESSSSEEDQDETDVNGAIIELFTVQSVEERKIERLLDSRFDLFHNSFIGFRDVPKDSTDRAPEEEGEESSRKKPRKDQASSTKKEYFVKWKGISYLHCEWIPEEEVLPRSSPQRTGHSIATRLDSPFSSASGGRRCWL